MLWRLALGVGVFALAMVLHAVPAWADIITLRNGDNVSQLEGVRIDRLSFATLPAGAPFQLITTPLTTLEGDRYGELNDLYDCLGRPSGAPAPHWCRGAYDYEYLQITFDTPTNFVSLSGRISLDPPGLLAFNAAGELLTRCMAPGGLGPGFGDCGASYDPEFPYPQTTVATLYLDRDQHDIARVIWGQVASWNMRIEEVSYAVPEPATIVLVSLGLLGIVPRSRNRRRPRERQ